MPLNLWMFSINLLKTIKTFFGLKGKVNNIIQHPIFLLFIFISCAPNSSKLAKADPNDLIEKADSLISQHPNDIELRNAIVSAYLVLAKTKNDPSHYKSALKFDPTNKNPGRNFEKPGRNFQNARTQFLRPPRLNPGIASWTWTFSP